MMLRTSRMKIIYLPFLFMLMALAAAPALAAGRSEAKSDIEAAQKTMGSLEKSELLKRYIPHKNYYDARVYLDTALYQFSEERDYANASYFAIMALIETETAISIARSRLAVRKKQNIERKIYRELAEGAGRRSQLRIALMEAGLSREGQNHQRFFLDSQVFEGDKFELTERGKKRLDAIASVMTIAPRSSLLVVGHTRMADSDNLRSSQKAEAVADYVKSLKGIAARRVTAKGAGDSAEITLTGRAQKADRVELILSGVQ
jgi:outer membrane protein OmpA-like peptidoglycan-associated protein